MSRLGLRADAMLGTIDAVLRRNSLECIEMEQVFVRATGEIVVKEDEHRFDFQMAILPTPVLTLVDVHWSPDDNTESHLTSLDRARLAARHAAEQRGWLKLVS